MPKKSLRKVKECYAKTRTKKKKTNKLQPLCKDFVPPKEPEQLSA